MENIKLFNLYPYTEVKVSDETLVPFINVSAPGIFPHTCTKINLGRFGKAKTSIVERFAVHLMQHGRNSGKKRLVIRLFREACVIMHKLTKENPVQLLVDACINAGPRESSSRVGRGGNMKRTSVDVSPYRRLNIALRLLAEGIRTTAFKNKKTMPEIIANEIMAAAKNSQNSYAVKKKEEIERVAKSNR
ncbi:ribosomal protein S7 [Vittaforma corneae ATCC 50505]|uniref:Ribosomal protein S7 n=1 Tax=Vittaforma corneae (strain ATCC 50505) TaxID=993615 RepID=L2GPW2_VITCO|nr:ribosomal protein S7 [Vittaforma corneae ATCC 50505]ELA42540.1 ribosomal protein S7 [Vittaforma corneae ATCC 50505]